MQIHELNNYNGDAGSNAFIAVDDGFDTGKKSISSLLAPIENEIDQTAQDLGNRIDNIIAGGTAPSAAEVTDARYGADGKTYASLGDAIRGQFENVKSAMGTYNFYKFQRIAGAGQYWNNTINVATSVGDTVRVTLDSYGGQYLNRVYVHGFYTENDWEEIGQILNVGDTLEVVTEKSYVKYRFNFYTSQDDGAITSSVIFVSDNENGVGKDIIDVRQIAGNYDTEINRLGKGYDWNELVETDNLSGAWTNDTNYVKNGQGITGYVTKVYDCDDIARIRFSGSAYAVRRMFADGTLQHVPMTMPATNFVFDTNEAVKIVVTATADKYEGASRIIVEGYTKIYSNWRNKKIVWFGTSIPAGGFKGEDNPISYPFQVGRKLGATVYNEAVGDSGVHYRELNRVSESNPYGFNFYFPSACRCLTNTIAMMEWLGNWADYYCNGGVYQNPEPWDSTIFTSGLPATWSSADTDEIKSFSYENKLDKYLTDATFPDLFVFDHGYNDRIRWSDATGTYEDELAQYGRDNCYTFRGAMNFLIDRIYSFNPRAKIILIGDYENQSDEKKYDSIYQLKVAEDYELPIFERWKYTGWSQVQETAHYTWSGGLLTYYSGNTYTKKLIEWNLADGVHPHSDKSGGATRQMTDLIVPFIEKI